MYMFFIFTKFWLGAPYIIEIYFKIFTQVYLFGVFFLMFSYIILCRCFPFLCLLLYSPCTTTYTSRTLNSTVSWLIRELAINRSLLQSRGALFLQLLNPAILRRAGLCPLRKSSSTLLLSFNFWLFFECHTSSFETQQRSITTFRF